MEAAIAREMQVKLCYFYRSVCFNDFFNLSILN